MSCHSYGYHYLLNLPCHNEKPRPPARSGWIFATIQSGCAQGGLAFGCSEQGRVAASCRGVDAEVTLEQITVHVELRNERQKHPLAFGENEPHCLQGFGLRIACDSGNPFNPAQYFGIDMTVEANDRRTRMLQFLGQSLGTRSDGNNSVTRHKSRDGLLEKRLLIRPGYQNRASRGKGQAVGFAGRSGQFARLKIVLDELVELKRHIADALECCKAELAGCPVFPELFFFTLSA